MILISSIQLTNYNYYPLHKIDNLSKTCLYMPLLLLFAEDKSP